MATSNDLKKQIKFELKTEIEKGHSRIKELKDSLSISLSLSGSFKGIGSGMAQNSVNNSIETKKLQIQNEEYEIAWYENIEKRYKTSKKKIDEDCADDEV